jgi:hypothetical protein
MTMQTSLGSSALIFLILLSLLTALPLLLWRHWFSARQLRIAYLCRWLLIPYLGLLTGALSPRLMGLSDIDWLVGFQVGLGLTFAILVALLLVRSSVDFDAPEPNDLLAERTGSDNAPDESLIAHQVNWTGAVRALLMAGGEEFHWSFLRAAVQEILLRSTGASLSAAYPAVWIAALLAAPEALLRTTSTAARFAQLITLIATTVLFLLTRNFWLCWALHAAIQFLWQFEVRPRPDSVTGNSSR